MFASSYYSNWFFGPTYFPRPAPAGSLPSPIHGYFAVNASVTGSAGVQIRFTQLAGSSAGLAQGQGLPIADTLRCVFAAAGTAADQVDGVYQQPLAFAANTPQTIDLLAASFLDAFGQPIPAARARFVAIKVRWTADSPLLVGGAGANEWDGFLSSGGVLKVFPATANNDGFLLLAAPSTLGMPITSSSHLLKLDPQANSGIVDLIIATSST